MRFSEVALQIVTADGTVVGQSPAIHPETASRELLLSGARSVYRAGETVELSSELHPDRSGLTYTWSVGTALVVSLLGAALMMLVSLSGAAVYVTRAR